MSVLIRDLLNFKEFETAKVIAGENGLLNEVLRVNFLELTLQEFKESLCLDVEKFVSVGDFYLTSSHFFDKEDVNFYEEFSYLIKQRSSGICIVGYRDGLIDDSIFKLVNENGYPIISLDYRTAYSNIIDAVMNAIIRDKLDKRIDDILYRIMNSGCDHRQIVEYLEEINPNLKDNYVTLFIGVPNDNLTNMIRNRIWTENREVLVHKLNKGTLVTITTMENDYKILAKEIEKLKTLIIGHFSGVHIGISDYYEDLKYFKESVNEAVFAYKIARKSNVLTMGHRELGIERWLNKLKKDKDLLSYVNDVLKPITDYEKDNNIELMKIVRAFVEYEGNYKSISKELYLHENTVRYRMDKIKDILNVGSDKVTLYTKLNIMVKLSDILDLG
ncbi:PucR family transcriptional regulator ligand-binding domain-containing protein [Wukongibacter baidiensis]|uniref:PucR family transcriptional regulator n=1 Tax=Wukongibacter baidiensis TaxID=1723361 RepID=UPI003D7F4A1C